MILLRDLRILLLIFKISTNQHFSSKWHRSFIDIKFRMMVWIRMFRYVCAGEKEGTRLILYIECKIFTTHLRSSINSTCNFRDVFGSIKDHFRFVRMVNYRWIPFIITKVSLCTICLAYAFYDLFHLALYLLLNTLV